MQNMLRRLAIAVLPLICFAAHAASELQNYVQQCQNELHFNANEVRKPDCHEGVRFRNGGSNSPINDFVGYQRVNDAVDLVFACRWVNTIDVESDSRFEDKTAASIELLIHNRQNGSTCFFNAKDTNPVDLSSGNPFFARRAVNTALISPTNFGAHPNADDYWLQPSELYNKRVTIIPNLPIDPNFPPAPDGTESIRCVGCHVQGSYIASPDIALELRSFGLLNDGHDTIVDMSAPNLTAPNHYHAVGSTSYKTPIPGAHPFTNFDSIIYNNFADKFNNDTGADGADGKPDPDCSGSCHSIGGNSHVNTLAILKVTLIPSLFVNLQNAGDFMEPRSDGPYRSVNMDSPLNGDGADYETLTNLGIEYPQFYCSNPVSVDANAVRPSDLAKDRIDRADGSDPNDPTTNRLISFSTSELSQIPNKLRAFNLRDGLVCVNSDQAGGNTCKDYQTAYYCNANWTAFQNHAPNSTGDNEGRSGFTGLCANPTAIRARYNKGSAGAPNWFSFNGPNDRLAQFNNNGLICVNADQGAGQICSNYAVRFNCSTYTSPPTTPSFKSSWSGMMLTSTSQQNDAETRGQPDNASWNSQDWVIEPIRGTINVRIKNISNGKYLHVQNQNESAKIVTYDLNTTWTSEQWTIEPIVNSNDVRIKNVWTAKYLTLVDTSNFSAVLSQSLNTSWASQRWLLQ